MATTTVTVIATVTMVTNTLSLQTICIALYVTGFAEAVVLKFDPNPTNHWLLRGIGIVTVLLLTVVALFGVKYLVRYVNQKFYHVESFLYHVTAFS